MSRAGERGEGPGAATGALDAESARRVALAGLRQTLRAPAEAVLGYVELLGDELAAAAGGEGESARQALGSDLPKMRRAARRLLEVMDDLLLGAGAAGARDDDPEAFESAVRHELRTPLNQIIGYAELLAEEAAETAAGERFAGDLGRIAAAGRDLLPRLEELLQRSRGAPDEALLALDPRGDAELMAREVLATVRRHEDGPAAATGAILVVDDVEVNRDLLARRLVRGGHRVVTAADGLEALERLAAEPFDLVLLDVLMPRMNGFEVLKRLKADAELRHVPVIMITALGEVESVVGCLELGAEDYLSKPFDPVILDARIGGSLEKKRLRDREIVHLRRIEEEKGRADRLLRVILPEEVVEELQETDGVRPRRVADVAVLFADVVGFTRYCDDASPEEVVAALQELVDLFEEGAEAHGLEKIKTIGDAFMATAGLLRPVADPVLAAVRCGLELAAGTRRLASGWRLRVGIHCGEVMAGIVGHKKFLYDVWGDTVNTASRVESNGEPGAVCLSPAAWARVADRCRGRSLGPVEIKGKGAMELWVVEGEA